MRLKEIEIAGFKSFAKKATLSFETPVTAVVGPNGSGKSNVVEAFRFVLGEQSMKSMRGKSGSDMIFRGSNSTSKLSRASVSVTFDNSDHVFAFHTAEGKSPVTFDTVTFTREIFADGTSKYSFNDTEIRLKQMVELLGSVNIGTSGHHIISQGEADSILRVNPRERREMLEDALGLKIYHFRIKESESKLEKTYETLKDVQSLRRELAPHLKFLQKQVEKIEKARAIRNELEDGLIRYLATERLQLQTEETRLHDVVTLIQRKKHELEARLADLPETKAAAEDSAHEIAQARTQLEGLLEKRRAIEQQINRLEGRVEAHRAMLAQSKQNIVPESAVAFAPSEYRQLLSDIDFFLSAVRSAETMEAVQEAISKLQPIIAALHARQPNRSEAAPAAPTPGTDLSNLAAELESLERDLKALVAEETSVRSRLAALEGARETMLRSSEQKTHERYEVLAAIKDCDSELQILAVTRSAYQQRKELFDTELKEAGFMFGPSFLHALKDAQGVPEIDLHDLKRGIDRLKIRLDEHSGIGDDVAKEYESTVERDQFLSREVTDIEGSIRNLEALIVDLKKVLDERFTDGVKVINDRFGEFFKTMFGGGNAFLSITMEKKRKRTRASDEELEDMSAEELEGSDTETLERGIEVHVSLPSKKVKELTMLSGGERSLVSIALLFAISQVNPPPFLVLDETDAALDEANSRRYGDMIETLAEYSQLIVVTHNRETMSRASVLYGVTLGSDGGSKLLSIKFDEAVKVAK
jgi:chromosome segregation protein